MIKLAAFVLALVLANSAPASAASIYVQSTANDPVGKQLTYSLRNEIGRSSVHKLASSREDAAFIIAIVTLEPDGGRNDRTIYSASLLMPPTDAGYDLYITSVVGACGAKAGSQCAGNILSHFDAEIAAIVEAISTFLSRQ